MAKTNAQRQAAYRARKKAERNETVTGPIGDETVTTGSPCGRYYLRMTVHGLEPFAEIVSTPRCSEGVCKWCDAGRAKWKALGRQE